MEQKLTICANVLCDKANEVDKHGNIFTEESLEKLDGVENLPVFLDFDFKKQIGIGKVTYAKGKGLLCTISGVDVSLFTGKKIAPVYSVSQKSKTETGYYVEECNIQGLGIVTNHSINDMPSI